MIKKISLIIFSLLLSFFLLEGIYSLHTKNTCDQNIAGVSVSTNEHCPFKYKPYKDINFDPFSKDISTDVKIQNAHQEYNLVDDISIPEDKVIIKQKTTKPKIAIVIDDMGIAHQRTLDILSIDAPLTLAFLTYSNNLNKYIKVAQQKDFEVMAHIPMQAKNRADEAPDCLLLSHSNKETKDNLNKMLDKFGNIKVINNHTGSLYTENTEKMNVIMKVLKKRNIAFLDSRTSAKSVGKEIAQKHKVKYLERNVFLDNNNNFDYILGQLKQTEKIAKEYGSAIAIAHPKSQTYKALKHWLKNLKDFEVVTLSEI